MTQSIEDQTQKFVNRYNPLVDLLKAQQALMGESWRGQELSGDADMRLCSTWFSCGKKIVSVYEDQTLTYPEKNIAIKLLLEEVIANVGAHYKFPGAQGFQINDSEAVIVGAAIVPLEKVPLAIKIVAFEHICSFLLKKPAK